MVLNIMKQYTETMLKAAQIPTQSAIKGSDENLPSARPFHSLSQHMTDLFKLCETYVKKVKLSETSVAGLEFMCFDLFSINCQTPSGEQVSRDILLLKRPAMDVIIELYGSYPDHRPSILEELIGRLPAIEVAHQKADRLMYTEIRSLLPITALVTKLVAITAGRDLIKGQQLMQEQSNDDLQPSQVQESATAPADAKTLESKESIVRISAPNCKPANYQDIPDLPYMYKQSMQLAAQFVQALVFLAWRPIKAGSQSSAKELLNAFVADLLLCVDTFEFTSSHALLQQMMRVAV